MKKLTAIFIVSIFLVTFTTPSFAYEPLMKLKGGVTDIIKSPLHVVDHTKAEMEVATFKPFGFFGGMLKGGFYMGKQMVMGLVDVVTFPIPDKT